MGLEGALGIPLDPFSFCLRSLECRQVEELAGSLTNRQQSQSWASVGPMGAIDNQ